MHAGKSNLEVVIIAELKPYKRNFISICQNLNTPTVLYEYTALYHTETYTVWLQNTFSEFVVSSETCIMIIHYYIQGVSSLRSLAPLGGIILFKTHEQQLTIAHTYVRACAYSF